MRYLGSKTLLVNQIERLVFQCCEKGVFFDPFGGIGTVGSHMKKAGFRVISSDLLLFAHYFQKSKIECNYLPDFGNLMPKMREPEKMETYMNSQIQKDGWLVEEYAVKRKYFTLENAYAIQGCIDQIWEWRAQESINETEYAILIASLIQAMDCVANTAGTYYAYLKEFYRKAKNKFMFRLMSPIYGDKDCICRHGDANELIKEFSCDVLYLDPPYNERDYGSYYHLPETIANGKVPKPKGKSGVFSDGRTRSLYTIKSQAEAAFCDLVHNSKSKYILFHYTDEGLIPIEGARNILQNIGRTEEYYFNCKEYHTTTDDRKSKHHIFKVDRT